MSCMQIMKMWVFGGTRAEFFVFQLFTQPVGNQGEFAAIARLPWPTCLSRFFWGRSLSIFFSLAKEFIIEAFFFSLLCFEYRKPFFIIKGKSKTISISLIHLAGCFCFPPPQHTQTRWPKILNHLIHTLPTSANVHFGLQHDLAP